MAHDGLVLVTGATGFLGGALTRTLLARGHRVRAIGRDPQRCALLRSHGAQVHQIDLRDAAAVREACAGVAAVVHAAARSAPWGRFRDFQLDNVAATQHVVTACHAQHVTRLVHISSPSVAFDGQDQFAATEQLPYPRCFTSAYAATKKLAEDVVRDAAGTQLQTITLRPKAIFGPGDSALLPRLLRAAAVGRLVQIGDGTNLVDLTFVDNVVHAIVLALDAPCAAGHTYTITNGEHVPLWDVVRRVLVHHGLPSGLRRVPLGLVMAAAALMEARARFDGREPALTRYSALVLARTQTYDISAARRDLGYEPTVGVDDGLQRTLSAMVPRRAA